MNENADGTKTVELCKPIMDHAGNMLTTLVFPSSEDVTIGEMGVLDEAEGAYSQLPYQIHALCKIPLSSAKAICLKDAKKIGEIMKDFFEQ